MRVFYSIIYLITQKQNTKPFVMPKLSTADKYDCRWRYNKYGGLKENMCESCQYFSEHDYRFWRSRNIKTTGKCSFLFGPNNNSSSPNYLSSDNETTSSNKVIGATTTTSSSTTSSLVCGTTTPSAVTRSTMVSRKQKNVTNYEPTHNSIRPTRHLPKKKQKIIQPTLDKLKGTQDGRKALMRAISVDPSKVSLPTGGTSKSAISKTKTSISNIANGLVDILSQKVPEQRQSIAEKVCESLQSESSTSKDTSIITMTPLHTPTESSIDAEEKHKAIMDDLASLTIEQIKGLKKRQLQRPFLALLRKPGLENKHTRENVEKSLGITITMQEWKNIGIHASFPGPLNPVIKKQIRRCRVDDTVLEKLLQYLDSPGNLQKYAFGTKLIEVMDGTDIATLARVDRHKKLESLVTGFLEKMLEDLSDIIDDELHSDINRCDKKDNKTCRNCIKNQGHSGKCEFSPKNTISRTALRDLISTLTGSDIKKLSGLDDVKVVQGRESFDTQRDLAKKYGMEAELVKEIDDVELYYQTEFIDHLEEVSSNMCNCLTCGFYNKSKLLDIENNINKLSHCCSNSNSHFCYVLHCQNNIKGLPHNVVCPKKSTHLPCCTKCGRGFGILKELETKVCSELEEYKKGTPMEENLEPWQNFPTPCQYGKTTHKYKKDLVDELKTRKLPSSGNRKELVERLKHADQKSAWVAVDKQRRIRTNSGILQKIQRAEQDLEDIRMCTQNLLTYRSHLARHKAEDKYGRNEIDNLEYDEAVIISDYKMKILPVAFRENQKKWFGKKGTTMIGFMIICFPPNTEESGGTSNAGKEVYFVMMLTDDSLQDDHAVVCAKSILYNECLPNHVKFTKFCSDGAGNFKSKVHRALQPFWKHWCGIDELTLRVTPAGDGKTDLDGMFGRFNSVLNTANDEGSDHSCAAEIISAIEKTNGLTSTSFREYKPNRDTSISVSIEGIDDFGSILTTKLNKSRPNNDNKLLAFRHSGYGIGVVINPATMIEYSVTKRNKKKEKIKIYNHDVSTTQLLLCFFVYCGYLTSSLFSTFTF